MINNHMHKSGLRALVIIILISLTFSNLMLVKANVIFQNSFDDGTFNNWVVVGSPNIVTTPTVAGSHFAAQFPFTSSPPTLPSVNNSYIQASFPQSSNSILEFYFQTDTVPQNVWFVDIVNGENSIMISLMQYINNGSLFFMLTYPTGEASGAGTVILSGAQPNLWYKFDITTNIVGNNIAIQVSINDLSVFSVSNLKFSWSPTVFKLGVVVNSGDGTGNVYIDNVGLTNSASNQQPTTTPTLSPTPSAIAPTNQPTASLSPSATPEKTQTTVSGTPTIAASSSPKGASSHISSLLLFLVLTASIVGFASAVVYAWKKGQRDLSIEPSV